MIGELKTRLWAPSSALAAPVAGAERSQPLPGYRQARLGPAVCARKKAVPLTAPHLS